MDTRISSKEFANSQPLVEVLDTNENGIVDERDVAFLTVDRCTGQREVVAFNDPRYVKARNDFLELASLEKRAENTAAGKITPDAQYKISDVETAYKIKLGTPQQSAKCPCKESYGVYKDGKYMWDINSTEGFTTRSLSIAVAGVLNVDAMDITLTAPPQVMLSQAAKEKLNQYGYVLHADKAYLSNNQTRVLVELQDGKDNNNWVKTVIISIPPQQDLAKEVKILSIEQDGDRIVVYLDLETGKIYPNAGNGCRARRERD